MRILKKIIKKLYYLIWFLGTFVIFIPLVNADVTIDGALFTQSSDVTFADNTNNNLTNIGATFISNGSYWRSNDAILTNGANIYGANFAFYSAVPFVQGHTYAVSILIGMANVSAKASSTRLCIAETVGNAISRNNLGFPCTTAIVTSSNTSTGFTADNITYNYTILSYIFTAEFTSNALTATYNTNGSNQSNHTFGGYIVRELSSQPLTQSQITSAVQNSGLATANSVSQVQSSINQIQTDINSSANNIINNNNQNTQDIINSSGSNTQSIIDNQNENSEKEIESQKVCKYIDKSSISLDNKYLSATGEVYNTNGVGITNYININSSTIEVLDSVTGSANSCFYNSNKELISCVNLSNTSGTITIPNKSQYFRATISKSQNKPTFNICQNGNQALNDSVNDLNDSLNDETAPNLDLSDLEVSSDTPISDLITMPLTILNSLVQALDGTCSNYTIPFLFNSSVTFPCFTISDYLGSNLTNYIDLFICFYMCYNIAMMVISVFEDITSLRDIYDSMYVPKHAYTGYQPKHAKGGGD